MANFLSPESRRRLRESNRRWQIYAILRLVVVVFSFIGFSVYASAIPIWNRYFYWGGGPNRGDWEDGFPLGILVFAFIWNTIALYLLLGRRRPVNPCVPLIIDFVTWATIVPAVTWSTGLGMFLNWTDAVEDWVTPELWHILVDIGRRELVGVIFSCFVWAIEVALFVFDCMDTHQWRKSRKAGKPSMRALDHAELVRDGQAPAQTGDLRPVTTHSSAPPKYEDVNIQGRDIELATSPTEREFA